MARSLLSPPCKTTSQLILSRFPRPPLIFSKKLASSSPHHRFAPSSRLFCTCSTQTQTQTQNDPIDMEQYHQLFSTRMAMAGLKPHHRIALGVSGGPDSMALCVLAAAWKIKGIGSPTKESSDIVDGLLAIVIDHGLRAESKDEANIVGCRVLEMGIRCEIVQCEWSNGRPKQGQLQEAARDKRYQIFQKVCIEHRIGALLLAHHADDQAELFIIRLSRGSGVLGLAGMPFTSQLFAKCHDINCKAPSGHSILLARPLLDLLKPDMYQICQGANQEWVEDPTNQNPSFTRNRIRLSLKDVSSSVVKVELLALVSACRRTRQYVDKVCSHLMHRTVNIMPEGYAVLDLGVQNMSEVEELILSRLVTLILQFVSQRQRPIRGSALKLLLSYIRTSPCKTCLTAAGCYLCPAPGSKGTKVLVCCTVNACLPLKLEVPDAECEVQSCAVSEEVEEIVDDGRNLLDLVGTNILDMNFLNTSSESILDEARKQNILNESSYRTITFLQRAESDKFKCTNGIAIPGEIKNEAGIAITNISCTLLPGQIGYFMDRFLVRWNMSKNISCNLCSMNSAKYQGVERQFCSSCRNSHITALKVRHMIDRDWLYLAELIKRVNMGDFGEVPSLSGAERHAKSLCTDHLMHSAKKALLALKSIPVGARRSLPVLVSEEGQLLSIPSLSFEHCPYLMASAVYKPRTPLGGGHSSFI